MKHEPLHMIRLLAEASTEKPVIVGWAGAWVGAIGTLTLERASQWVALFVGVLTCISIAFAIGYTGTKWYFLVRNKGKEK